MGAQCGKQKGQTVLQPTAESKRPHQISPSRVDLKLKESLVNLLLGSVILRSASVGLELCFHIAQG